MLFLQMPALDCQIPTLQSNSSVQILKSNGFLFSESPFLWF